MIGTIVFCRLTQKGPCGMTVNNDIDDDSASKHSNSHRAIKAVTEGSIHKYDTKLKVTLSLERKW